MREKLEKLNSMRGRLQKYGILAALICIAAFIVSIFNKGIAIAVFAAAVLLYLFIIRPAVKSYRRLFKIYNIEESMSSCLKNISYIDRNAVDKEEFERWWRGNKIINFLSLDSIEAEYQNMKLRLGDISLAFENGDGATKRKFDSFSGIICIFKLPFDTGRELMVNPEGIDRLNEGELKLRLKNLKDYTTGELSFGVRGDELMLMIKNRFLSSRSIHVRDEISERLLRFEQFPEIHSMLRVADCFKKNSEVELG